MMMDSKMPSDVNDLIETLLDLLGAHSIAKAIEGPIDKATAEFSFHTEGTITYIRFNHVISAYVRHIYKTALPFPRTLSDREALAEAIHLLIHYSDVEGPDRCGAILASVVGGGRRELEIVLLQLSELIKEIERQKYKRWVLTRHFWSLNWESQCHVVSYYKKSLTQSLPPEMEQLKPEQLVEYFEDFIQPDVMFRNIFRKANKEEGKSSWKVVP